MREGRREPKSPFYIPPPGRVRGACVSGNSFTHWQALSRSRRRCAVMLMIRGLYSENGNRDHNLVYKIQWGSGVLPRYTISILGLRYATQGSMQHTQHKAVSNGDATGERGRKGKRKRRRWRRYGAGARRRGGIGRLCLAMSIRMAMAWAHARPMAERL